MGQHQSSHQRVRALLISPTYQHTPHYLECTVNDAKGWHDFLTDKAHIPTEQVRWLSDTNKFPAICRPATAHDIQEELASLLAWANSTPKPVIFLAYSGHGTQQKDTSGDEEDGYDEGWVAQDLAFVRDDYLNQHFLALLPKSAQVIAVNDACHNGTVWDTNFYAVFNGKQQPAVSAKKPRSLLTEVTAIVTSPQAAAERNVQPPQNLNKTKTVKSLFTVILVYASIKFPNLAIIIQVFAFLFSLTNPATFAQSSSSSSSAVDSVSSLFGTRYSSAVQQTKANTSQETKPADWKPLQCSFTALSSSSDKQVSYEGAKNGFFTYNLQTIVNKELAPLLAKAQSPEHLFSLWNRTGFSLVQDLGNQLHKQGIPQNPVWQAHAAKPITASTPLLLE